MLRPEAKYGVTRLLVEFIRRELHEHTVEPLQGEAEHKKLGLGIDAGPLPRRGEPRPANLDLSRLPVDLPEASRTDDNARRFEDVGDERDDCSVRPAFSAAGLII